VRRRWILAAAVAAVVALVVGTTAILVSGDTGSATDEPTTVSAESDGVSASVTISAADTGSRLELTLSGVPSGQRCQLVAVADDGHREVAGSWVASYTGTATITGLAAASPDELSRLEVETLDGRTLVDMPTGR
jgi:hypothetical protein